MQMHVLLPQRNLAEICYEYCPSDLFYLNRIEKTDDDESLSEEN